MTRFAVLNGLVLAAAALPTNIVLADSTVVISLAGEAFEGPPAFELMVGDKVIGAASLERAIETEVDGRLFSNPRPSRFLEEFTFTVPDDSLLPGAEISIALTNDKYAASEDGVASEDGFDRNIFVAFIRVNGHEVPSADMALTQAGEIQDLDYQAGLLPIYEAGQRIIVKPPAGGWPPPVVPASMTERGLLTMPAMASWTWQVPERNDR